MGFWIFMLISNLLIPLTMIGFGILFVKKTPASINMLYGYRTPMSMLNSETWVFAQHYCGRFWYRWGLGLLPFTILAMSFVIGKEEDTVGIAGGIICFIQMLPMVGVIASTEWALNKTFDKTGRRK